jgi:hypothetical protein
MYGLIISRQDTAEDWEVEDFAICTFHEARGQGWSNHEAHHDMNGEWFV